MRKVKLLSVLLAVVMIMPMAIGLGVQVSADDMPVYQLLVYLKNPGDRSTFESLKLPELTTYASGSVLTDATEDQMSQLTDKNVEYITIGRSDLCFVGNRSMNIKGKNLVFDETPDAWYGELADFDYESISEIYYVVNFVGPTKRAWLDKIADLGGYVMDSYPISNQTYLMKIDRTKIDEVKKLSYVRAVGLYSPICKTDLWVKDDTNMDYTPFTVNLTIAGNLTNDELRELSEYLKGFGCKTLLQSRIENFYAEEAPAREPGMTDEEYDEFVNFWEEDRNIQKKYYEGPVSENDSTPVREAAEIFTYGTVGAVNHGSEEPYELAFTRVIVPATSIDDVARLPQVLGIELFSAPESQNDLTNYTIGSHYAWAANETTGIVADATDPLPQNRLDHFGLHGESFVPTNCQIGGDHYRQIVAVVGTGLDTGDVNDTYDISGEYGTAYGDFAYRVVDHLAYCRPTTSYGNWANTSEWRWPPTTGSPTRVQRASWANINMYLEDFRETGVRGSRSYPWMDWDGHETHVTGSGFGDGFWSLGQTPNDDDTALGRQPYGPLPGVAPNSPNLEPPYGVQAPGTRYDYRGVAYRAGIVVQRVTHNNFNRARSRRSTYLYYWGYTGRPHYIGLYDYRLPESGYLRAKDGMFTIINDAYNVGARIQVNAWVVPHRGRSNGLTPPNPAGDREITFDSMIYNSNEYNFFCTQMDRFTWEKKDMLLVQAGTTNTRFAAPFIYDFEPYNFIGRTVPAGAYAEYDQNPTRYSSPWCYTTPPVHDDWLAFGGQNIGYPVLTPNRGVYYPPIGDTSTNLPVEFNYYYQDITQPPTMDYLGYPPGNADGKADYASSALSPATAKNPITVGASESYRNIQNNFAVMPDDTLANPKTPQFTQQGPWVYGFVYGPWFSLDPLATDNTADSDAPYAVDNQGNNMWENEDALGYARPNGYGQVAAFSGRGPTPDLDYSHGDAEPSTWEPAGRFKPDIVAPGTQIMSAASFLTLNEIGDDDNREGGVYFSGNQWNGIRQIDGSNYSEGGPYTGRHPSIDNPSGLTAIESPEAGGELYKHYAIMEGTSCATGFVAGAAAITRQFYENRGLTMYPTPSASLIKATLIHGARNLGGEGDYDGAYQNWLWLSAKPNYDQGFGRLDIKQSLYPDPPTYTLYEDHQSGITTGEKHYFYYEVTDSTVPFEATLAYTDMPKLPNPQVALANDLDLIIVDPGGTEYHGNIYQSDPHIDEHTNAYAAWGRVSQGNPGGTTFDRRNNVERVVIPPVNIKEGRWTVIVSGARVEQSSTNIPQLYSFLVSGGNLRAAVAPPPEVPTLSPISLLLVIFGLIGVGAFFILRRKAEIAA